MDPEVQISLRRWACSAVLLCLVVSCASSQNAATNGNGTPDTPETQPTPILGSGKYLFTYANGTITCTTKFGNDPTKVQCVAQVQSGGGTGNTALIRVLMAQFVQATGFDTSILSHSWDALQVTPAGGTTINDSDMVVSTDGISVVYTLPASIPSGTQMDLLAQLQISASDGNGGTLSKAVQATAHYTAQTAVTQ